MSNHKMYRILLFLVPPVIAAPALPVLGSATAQAQTPTVFHFCLVPTSGLIYFVDPPEECKSPSHIEFSFTEGVPGHDHEALNGLGDDDHPEYVREGEAAGGDLGGSYPDPTVAKLQGSAVSATTPSDGQVLTFSGTTMTWQPATPATGGGASDHGLLTGLADDDHNQYVLADGVRSTTNGFAVTGTEGIGSIPASGAGTRLMWYPRKAAFRAGVVNGTQWDDANIGRSSTAMGFSTTASGAASTAMGSGTTASENTSTAMGFGTTASGVVSTAMGSETTASGSGSTAMGIRTTASIRGSTAMGNGTSASGHTSTAMGFGTTASGLASTAMGNSTIASGNFTTAMGLRGSTNEHQGSFVYGDASTLTTTVNVTANNSFVVRAQHVFFGKSGDQVATTGRYIETSTGAYLTDGGTWMNASDRDRKENFRDEDGEGVLARIAQMPIQSWTYKAEDASVRHLGPTAQDFYAAFGLGDSDKAIPTVDIDGVNMLAIQALETRTRELAELRQRLAALEAALARLEAVTEANQR